MHLCQRKILALDGQLELKPIALRVISDAKGKKQNKKEASTATNFALEIGQKNLDGESLDYRINQL